MPVLDGAPRMSFDGIEFPFTERTLRGEFRHVIHEFPKMAGGDPEKLGRKLLVISVQSPFHASNPFFPNLYPQTLDLLTERWGKGTTSELQVPELGVIRAFITRIERRRRGGIRSGEEVSLEFTEDDLEPFRRTSTPSSSSQLAQSSEDVSDFLADNTLDPQSRETALVERYKPRLGSLLGLVDSVLAIRDQVELYGARVAAQLEGIAATCRELHQLLKGADLSPLREALRSLWDAATQLKNDLLGKGEGSALVSYVVPRTMSVGQIAQARYGDASRGGELLALNPDITDPFAVRVASRLVVYAA